VPKYTSDGTDIKKNDDNGDDDAEESEKKQKVDKKGIKG